MAYPDFTMQSARDNEQRHLEAQLASKEKEWKELQAARVHHLETSLQKAQEVSSSLREYYQKMREDFQFNLAILDERDRELKRYEAITARAATVEHHRQQELSMLRLQMTELEEQRARESKEYQEELRESWLDATQQRLQLDSLKLSLTAARQTQSEEYKKMKQKLQCRIQELEGELTQQRQEMTSVFDRELKQQEHKFNLTKDEMCAGLLSLNFKVKLMSKDTEVHYQSQLQATEALKSSQQFCQQMKAQLQHKEQELRVLTAVKDIRIKELEEELKGMETKLKKNKADHIKKFKVVSKALKDSEAQMEFRCQANAEQLQMAENEIVKLQEKVEEARCIHKDQQEQKDKTIQRLLTEVEKAQSSLAGYMSQVSSEMVVRDSEMVTLQEREAKLRVELGRSREETEGYKQQLSAGLQREKALEQLQVQVELEWQRRCEEVKAQHYLANEQLIQDLSLARDQAKTELKEKERELEDLAVLFCSVKMERDQIVQGFTPKLDSLASEEIHHLQEQNSSLRAVVAQMRKDMESLSHLLPLPRTQSQASPSQPARHPPPAPSNTSKAGISTKHTEISPKVNAPVGERLQKCADASEVRASCGESALGSITEQNSLVQPLRKENQYLQLLHASGQMSSGAFEIIPGAKDNTPLLRTRLKQAALCIRRLTLEKQQLIEMGNRLRIQITSTGLHEAVEPQRDATADPQSDKLSALQQLQYQLTKQELQYAFKDRSEAQLLTATTNTAMATTRTTNLCSQGHRSKDKPESSWTVESRSGVSSVESACSLQGLWEILDHGLSSSIFSEGDSDLNRRELIDSGDAGLHMTVHGISAPVHSHAQAQVQKGRGPSSIQMNAKSSRPAAERKSKIRNYNLKD